MFVFLQSDSFGKNSHASGKETRELQRAEGGEYAPIRRPYRGIQIKNDTYAVLSVRRASGVPIPLTSSSAVLGHDEGVGKVDEYSDFILQTVQESRTEKSQIIETFGEVFAYFYGEKARVVQVGGLLMNTEDFNWRAQFWANYDEYLRGSKLVERGARCYLAYDTVVLEGYPLGAVASDDSDDPYTVPFQMSILLTNYHEYSTVGAIRFPGVHAASYDVLNDELAERRHKFTSTGIQVRQANLNSAISDQIPRENSVLSLMRKGVSAWNEAQVWLGDKLDIARRLYGGRTLRVPVGVASYIQAVSVGELAPASVLTSGSYNVAPRLGGEAGEIEINGITVRSNKLRIMGPVKFGPGWKSEITNNSRGMIFENYDEYPLRRQPQTLADFENEHTKKFLKEREDARLKKVSDATEESKSLALYNTLAAQGGVLGTVAEVVTTIREGYGMLLTAANLVENPLGAAAQALGVSPQQLGGVFSALEQASRGDFSKLGNGLISYSPGLSRFLGEASRKTWANWADRVAKTDVESLFLQGEGWKGKADLGEVYNTGDYVSNAARQDSIAVETADAGYSQAYGSNDYVRAGGAERDYDLAYGDSDYTSLIDAQEALDAEAATQEGDLPEGVTRTEANAGRVADSIDEVYGNTDNASFGEDRDEPETLEEVYGGEGTIQQVTLTDDERAALMAEAYGGSTYTRNPQVDPASAAEVYAPTTYVSNLQTEGVSGITAVGDDDAPIDPVI